MQNDIHSNPFVKAAIDSLGGPAAVARLFDVSPWAVAKWARRLPEGRALDLSKATDFTFTPHQLLPGLYPNPWDALPLEKAKPLLDGA
ncbi:MAG: helix-turn-helix domain-containing protein [Pseudogulbenkiania sp.]|nr:helix-turn-helix domain-containing protein [Pseudogulbenkiania sp.]